LKSASNLDEERKILAQTLPLTALKQLEQSVQEMFAWKGPEDCQVRVKVQNEHGREFVVKGRTGETFMDLVKRGTELKDYLECACGGNMTCSTCHVYVDAPESVAKGASPEEQDMLDLAWEPKDDMSRLGCQIKLKPNINLVVEIPKHAFNHFK
jgi:2Fe-2S ferredoxin